MNGKHDGTGSVSLGDHSLTVDDVLRVARNHAQVEIRDQAGLRERLERSRQCITDAVEAEDTVYGVNTGFGGMVEVQIEREDTPELQKNLLWFLKAGAGKPLRKEDVRAAMLLRAKSFLHGASGVRWELVERLQAFLNGHVTPVVREYGSIGASGDLVPLASIAGALIGLDPDDSDDAPPQENRNFKVFFGDQEQPVDARVALEQLDLAPISLLPKEGLGLVNGTSMSTAMAATCLYDARFLFAVSLGVHALLVQGLRGMVESFDPFVHQLKPHPGQLWVARQLRRLLDGSRLVSGTRSGEGRPALDTEAAIIAVMRNPEALDLLAKLMDELRSEDRKRVTDKAKDHLLALSNFVDNFRSSSRPNEKVVEAIQDRYSIRCLPQFAGPIRDGLLALTRQIEIEMNSANDNPLIDADAEDDHFFHCGNFLGQYTSVAMDQLRYYISLLAKHLDSQIALVVAPEFNEGLPASLVGNKSRRVNMGLKGLQISGNSITPLLAHLGNSIADRFPSHAEQFNQNINSLSFPSAHLARQSVDLFRQYLSIGLLFGIQAVELRTHMASEAIGKATYDPRSGYLSPGTRDLYTAVRSVIGRKQDGRRPYVYNDNQQALDEDIERLAEDLRDADGEVGSAIRQTRESLEED